MTPNTPGNNCFLADAADPGTSSSCSMMAGLVNRSLTAAAVDGDDAELPFELPIVCLGVGYCLGVMNCSQSLLDLEQLESLHLKL